MCRQPPLVAAPLKEGEEAARRRLPACRLMPRPRPDASPGTRMDGHGRAGPSRAACAEPPRRASLAAVCLLARLGLLLGSEITCRRLLTANENPEGFQFMTMKAVEERAVKLQFACWDGDGQLQTSCRIQKCTTDFVSLTSHLNSALESFDLEFCKALRAYSACTYRNSKVCRGNLVYHSAVLGISDLMSQRNCSKDGPTSSSNPEVTHDPCNYSGHPEAREHQGREKTASPTYLFCGLFGDPHLRTFKDRFQTCKVEGAWPLIDNNYLSVQVTNVPVVAGSRATATNKITIIFKSYQDCTDQKVYQAVTDDLPAAFVDGTTSGGDGNTKSLRIVEKVSGKYVEMHARYIGTTVYVRQLGHYLTLAIRMPQEVVMAYEESQDLQLCVNGCPSSERIDDSGHLPLPVMSHFLPQHGSAHPQSVYTLETATTKCHEKMLLKDIYFYSCVFDLLTTGDANFTAAAHSALQDVESLHPRKEHWHIFPNSEGGGVDKGSKFFVGLGLVCLILVAFL